MNDNQQQPAQPDDPERVPLHHLARQHAASPALTRIVQTAGARRGPGRVAVAAFNSSV